MVTVREAIERVNREHVSAGVAIETFAPATAGQIEAAERAAGTAFPPELRDLLALTDGLVIGRRARFLGTGDHITGSRFLQRAREMLSDAAEFGDAALRDALPVANLVEQPNWWIIYRPAAGFVHYEPEFDQPFPSLAEAIVEIFEQAAKGA
jgi:cell wall assembly regulator SMI1